MHAWPMHHFPCMPYTRVCTAAHTACGGPELTVFVFGVQVNRWSPEPHAPELTSLNAWSHLSHASVRGGLRRSHGKCHFRTQHSHLDSRATSPNPLLGEADSIDRVLLLTSRMRAGRSAGKPSTANCREVKLPAKPAKKNGIGALPCRAGSDSALAVPCRQRLSTCRHCRRQCEPSRRKASGGLPYWLTGIKGL
jgi:hypothetical protein